MATIEESIRQIFAQTASKALPGDFAGAGAVALVPAIKMVIE
jgi:hypothetical protein